MPPYAVLPPPPQLATQAQGYSAMFDAPMRRHTLLVALGFFSLMFAFYFVISWTPKLLVTSGASAAEGITGGVLLNLGGIGGGILFSGLASCVRLSRLTVGSLLLMGLAMLAFGLCSTQLNWAFAMALLTGAAMFAAVGGMYAIVPIVFTAAVRSTALGWAIGWGASVPSCRRSAPVYCWMRDGRRRGCLSWCAAAGRRRSGCRDAATGTLSRSAGATGRPLGGGRWTKEIRLAADSSEGRRVCGGFFPRHRAQQSRHAQNHRLRSTPPRHVCRQAAGRVGAPSVLEDLVPGRFRRCGQDP